MPYLLIRGDARRIPLRSESVHCVVTSPPYWGLRDYGAEGQVGLEATPDEFVSSMVSVFREVHRILRPDGTLWLNLGDSYANDAKGYEGGQGKSGLGDLGRYQREASPAGLQKPWRLAGGLKKKDLVGIPWRVALALQADGWYLRSDIIWAKANPMPESVTDRPSKSHEYLFLFAKSESYYYDADAIREPVAEATLERDRYTRITSGKDGAYAVQHDHETPSNPAGRNKRTVWQVATVPFKGAHFATFPPRLIEPCVKAGTSERGCCPDCGTPWERVTSRERVATRPGNDSKTHGLDGATIGNRDPLRHVTRVRSLGWQPSCRCNVGDPVPCVVFDPFGGAATTVVVAEALGRRGVVTELSPEYLGIARRRLERPHAPAVRRPPESDANERVGLLSFGAEPDA